MKRIRTVSETFQEIKPMYSTADVAKRLGCTVQAVNKYRRKIEKRDGKQLGKPEPTDARRTVFSEDEVALIAELAPRIPVSAPTESQILDAELIDGIDTETAIAPKSTSLALRHSTMPATQRQRFDLVSAQQNLEAIQTHTHATASRADTLLSELAVVEILQAAADIRQTVATLKANALGDALATLGKSDTAA